jgi:nitrogen regulatory protein PII
MKRVTLILRTSEVMAVRKAACIAGANRMVVQPISHRECEWVPFPHVSAEDVLIRLVVTVVDSQYDEVLSAIITTMHFGKLENVSPVNAKHALSDLCKLAA